MRTAYYYIFYNAINVVLSQKRSVYLGNNLTSNHANHFTNRTNANFIGIRNSQHNFVTNNFAQTSDSN